MGHVTFHRPSRSCVGLGGGTCRQKEAFFSTARCDVDYVWTSVLREEHLELIRQISQTFPRRVEAELTIESELRSLVLRLRSVDRTYILD
jgi:hypothetical protein